jgi:hypothetical protein
MNGPQRFGLSDADLAAHSTIYAASSLAGQIAVVSDGGGGIDYSTCWLLARLGAHLARLELRVFLRELIPRVEQLELDGEPVQVVSNFAGGLKNLPVRYRLKPAASA